MLPRPLAGAALGALLSTLPASAYGQASPPPTPSGPLFRAAPDTPPPPTPLPAAPPQATQAAHDARLVYAREPGAESCPDESGFREQVAGNVGRDPFTASTLRVAAVTIRHEGGLFVGRMEIHLPSGLVEWKHDPLTRADCRDLVRAMALSIAIPIDPFPAHPPPAPATPAAPSTLPPPFLSTPPPARDVDRSSSSGAPGDDGGSAPKPPAHDGGSAPKPSGPTNRPAIRLGLRAAVELGTAPAVTGGFALQVGARWPLASLSAEGRVDVPVSGAGNVLPMTRVSAGFYAGSLVPCAHVPLPAHFDVPLCGLLTIGAVQGSGLTGEVQKSGFGVYVGAGGRVGLEIPVNETGAVALRAEGDLLGAIKPVTMTANGHDAWNSGRVSGGVGGGARVDF